MKLNIYYSKNFLQKDEYKKFFIDNFLFKEKKDYLAGELIDMFFYEIQNYQKRDGIDIVLIDEKFVSEYFDDGIKNIVENELKQKWENDEKSIFFVALTENFAKLDISNYVNIIRAYDKENIFEFLFTEIAHNILRKLLNKEKLKIFISHAKADSREIAKRIKEYIDSYLKLDNFFDEVEILDSQNWSKKLEEEIREKNSLFMYILSDNYAKTLWTKKELMIARESKKPIIGIDVLSNQNEIPLLISNTKIFKLLQDVQKIEINCNDKFLLHTKHNLRKIINVLLKEALIFEIGKNKGINLPRRPDLFDACKTEDDIIYPDPPMMNIELKEIFESCGKKNIYTPLTKDVKNLDKKIAISISESPDLEEKGMTIEHLNLLMIEIARYLIINGATLIYGGDLGYKKEFNFTTILAETFRAYNRLFDNSNQKLINCSAYPFCKNIDEKIKNKNRDAIEFDSDCSCIGEDCNYDDIEIIAKNLTKMREKITQKMDLKIAVGGKINGFSGFYPGVLEEIYLALKAEKPVILVEGFGGIVDKIVDFINGKEVEELSFEYQTRVNPKLDKFLKEKNLVNEVEDHYEKMLKIIKENKNYLKVIKFNEFSKFIENLLKCL